MGASKRSAAKEKPKQTAGRTHQGSENQIGGREFGQVIEPMQAQMASENEGLADLGKPAKKVGAGIKGKAA